MRDDRSLATRRTQIDARLEAVLPATGEDGLAVAREVIEEPDDRWYGLLVTETCDSMADTGDVEAPLSAAVAIELLRGYFRLRSELLVQLADERAHSLTRDPTTALLAGDYLYSAAYRSLGSSAHTDLAECFETVTSVLTTITEAFTTLSVEPAATSPPRSFFDETAGSIGEGAAALGAVLAGADGAQRDTVAQLGRGFSTAREIDQFLDPENGTTEVVSPIVNEQRFREHARQKRDDARQALQTLSARVDAEPLRTLVGPDDSKTDRNDPSRENGQS
ncbi:polyprenyl synthetase [Natrinema sp. 74]|uniref:polyprenyl synthetase n=1 Tax=Natrinema sp. 74 TaxID=3384159 RepID=UPI0038D48D69